MNRCRPYKVMKMLMIGILLIPGFRALASPSVFEQANQFYREKQYEKAIAAYQQQIRKGERNSAVYYNLGNAFYRVKQFPAAIVYYEKALKLDPGNEKTQFNLKLANDKALSKIESSREFFVIQFISGFLHEYGARTWAIAFIIVLWIGVIALILVFRRPAGSRTVYTSVGITALLLAVLMFGIARHRYAEQTSFTHAVVMRAGAELKAEPVQAAKTRVSIEAGNKVKLLDRDADWYKVALANGKTGWLHANSIVLI